MATWDSMGNPKSHWTSVGNAGQHSFHIEGLILHLSSLVPSFLLRISGIHIKRGKPVRPTSRNWEPIVV